MDFKPNDEVVLVGKVVNIFYTNQTAILTCDCSWKNYPKVTVSKELFDANPKITEGSIVSILGCIRHSVHGCGKITFSIFADELEVIEDEPVLFRNEFYLCAEIEHVKRLENKVVVFTKVNRNNEISYVPVTLPKSALEQFDNIESTKHFRGCGIIRTGKTVDKKGVHKFFEEYVAQSWKID